jgi:hypothetical protein
VYRTWNTNKSHTTGTLVITVYWFRTTVPFLSVKHTKMVMICESMKQGFKTFLLILWALYTMWVSPCHVFETGSISFFRWQELSKKSYSNGPLGVPSVKSLLWISISPAKGLNNIGFSIFIMSPGKPNRTSFWNVVWENWDSGQHPKHQWKVTIIRNFQIRLTSAKIWSNIIGEIH